MTLPRSVADVLSRHVLFEVESIDRLYCNLYVPQLQRAEGIVGFIRGHLGQPIASTAAIAPMSRDFVARLRSFADAHDIPRVDFARGQRKDDVMHEHLAAFEAAGRTEGVLFIGRAQEKNTVFRTEKRRAADGRSYPWIVRTTSVVNQFYVHCVDEDFGGCPFERYADDAVVHCATERQASQVLAALGERMAEVGLQLHPDKTKIVYCKDSDRRGSYEHTSFTFLGFEFRGRRARGKNGGIFTSFLPAASKDALKKMSATVRSWRLHRRTGLTMGQLAREINPVVRGWIQYYGAFGLKELYPLLQRINYYLVRWLRKKYRRLRTWKKLVPCWERITSQYPAMFAHWRQVKWYWRTG